MNYKTLPRGYVYAGNLDFMRNRAQMKIVVVLSLALTVLPALAGLLIAPVGPGWRLLISRWWGWPALGLALILYIPLLLLFDKFFGFGGMLWAQPMTEAVMMAVSLMLLTSVIKKISGKEK